MTDLNEPDQLYDLSNDIGVDTLQLVGKITLESLKSIIVSFERNKDRKIKIVKTISMNDGDESKILTLANEYSNYSDAILLDSVWGGGSGKIHNWDLSKKIVDSIKKPVILAGGLTPENILQAIGIVKPYGVDVQTGVEDVIEYYKEYPIKCKNPLKIKEFIYNVKGNFKIN